MKGKLVIFNHPLINHKLGLIRDKNTNTKQFRETVNEIGALMAYEITRDFPTRKVVIETPITKTHCDELDCEVVIVPILRAGLGMVEGISNLIPTAKIGHIGLYRDESTLMPKEYYAKFPPTLKNAEVLLLDPMLATGGSASYAITLLKKRGVKRVHYVGLVGAPEGIKKLQNDHPEVDIFLASVDEKLNENGYIVPGLGDCGDRLFGTK